MRDLLAGRIRAAYAGRSTARRRRATVNRIRIGALAACVCSLTWLAEGRAADVPSSGSEGGEDRVGTDCEVWNTQEFFQSATPASIAACLDAGVDINERVDRYSLAPLHWAVMADNAQAVTTLLGAGAEVDIGMGDFSFTPLSFAQSAVVAQILLAADADVAAQGYNLNTPLHMAAKKDVALFITLIEAGADVNAMDGEGRTPLHNAARINERPEVIEALLANGGDLEARDDHGNTPLHVAVRNSNSQVIKTLIASGADVGATDKYGNPVLFNAVREGANPDAAGLLLEAGADPTARGQADRTALHKAVEFRGLEGVVPILLGHGADPNSQDEYGATPLHVAAFGTQDPVTVETLLAAGGDIEARDKWGHTPLHKVRELPVLEAMLSAGARVDARNRDGETVLHTASNAPVIQRLVAAGARLEARDQLGRTPLHSAADGPVTGKATRALIELGANVEARDETGNTPLLLAAQHQDSHTFDYMATQLAEGKTTQEEYDLQILFTHAAEAITALLEAGANAMARNAEGHTPWDLARENEPLKTSEAYWQLNDARFAAPAAPGTGGSQAEPRRQATTPEDKQSRTCEIPGYPSPTDVQSLGLSWCGSNVGFQRRAFALQAAGAWCAIAGGSSSSPDQIAARHREIDAACDRLDAMQSAGTPSCRCPAGYRP